MIWHRNTLISHCDITISPRQQTKDTHQRNIKTNDLWKYQEGKSIKTKHLADATVCTFHILSSLFARTLKPRTDVIIVQPWCDLTITSFPFQSMIFYGYSATRLSFQTQQLLGPNHAGQGLELNSKIPKVISPPVTALPVGESSCVPQNGYHLAGTCRTWPNWSWTVPIEISTIQANMIGLLIQCKFGMRMPVCIFSSMLDKLSKVCESALLEALDMKYTVCRCTARLLRLPRSVEFL